MDKFVLHVPKWQGELSFSKETLIFAGAILLMFVGILFCFWGYKFFRTILFMGIGTVTCYGSYLLVEPMTDNSVIRMFLTVSLTFLGVCFVYFLDIIVGFILDKLRIRHALGKRIYLLAAPLGAAILGLTIYFMIWQDVIVAGAIAAVCLVVGLVFQHSKRNKQVRFRSYDDLIKLSRQKFDGDGLEYISLGEEAVAAPEMASSGAAAIAAPAAVLPGAAAVAAPETAEPETVDVEPVEAAVRSEPIPEAVVAEPVGIVVEAEPEFFEPDSIEVVTVEPEQASVEPAAIESEQELTESMEAVVIEDGSIAVSTEPESVKPVAFEPEPKFVRPVALEAELEPAEHFEPVIFESEPESVKPAVFEPEPKFVVSAVHGAGPKLVDSTDPTSFETEPEPVEPMRFEPEPRPVEAVCFEPEPEPVDAASLEAETEPVEPVAFETKPETPRTGPGLAESLKPVAPKMKPDAAESVVSAAFKPAKISIRMESAASEVEVDILEDTLFLKRINNHTKEKQNITITSDGYEGTDFYSDKASDRKRYEQKPEKKQEWKLTGGVALMAFGLGVLIARTSKGRD